MKYDTQVACNLCGASDASCVSKVDRDGKPLSTVICNQCGLVYTSPRPSSEAIDAYYNDDYRVNYKNAYEPKIKHIFRAGHTALNRYSHFLANRLSKGDELLDVGAGGGEFLYLLKSLGYNAEGVEPNKGYANYAASQYNVNIIGSRLDALASSDKQYDFITCYHVLEHMYDPSAALQQMVNLCKKDGRVLIEVPNIEAVCQHPNNKFHLAHLYNFNIATLSAMGEKLGLSVECTAQSPDKGNIVVIFRNLGLVKQVQPNPENVKKVKRILASHTQVRHLLSPYPYVRVLRKLQQAIKEAFINKKYKEKKLLLDELYAPMV